MALQRFLSKLEIVEVALPVFRFSGFVHQVQIAESLVALHTWLTREGTFSASHIDFGIRENN